MRRICVYCGSSPGGRPCYFDHLLRFMDQAVDEGFVKKPHRDMLLVDEEADRQLDLMADYQPPRVDKLIGKGET